MKQTKSILTTALFMTIIFMPLCILALGGTAEGGALYGEKSYAIAALSPANWFSRDFQRSFEDWFSKSHPLRTELVVIYNAVDKYKDNINLLNLLPAAGSGLSRDERVPNGEPKYPEYVLSDLPSGESGGYRGNERVIIGKDGCLFENGYINEYLGAAQKYRDVSDEQLRARVESLLAIQEKLAAMDKAFTVVITPSKGAYMADYIPDFYLARFTLDPAYRRPYIRFRDLLNEYGVNTVDSSAVYAAAGLTNVFPKTGTHWNKLAAYETTAALIREYTTQTGIDVRSLEDLGITKSRQPPGYGNPEDDIFGIVYSGRDSSDAISDEWYYDVILKVDSETKPQIKKMIVQGGSFTDDFDYYFTEYNLAAEYEKISYNNGGDVQKIWSDKLESADYIVLEVNEQYVYGMGGNPPQWGQNDLLPAVYNPDKNIVDALQNHLLSIRP